MNAGGLMPPALIPRHPPIVNTPFHLVYITSSHNSNGKKPEQGFNCNADLSYTDPQNLVIKERCFFPGIPLRTILRINLHTSRSPLQIASFITYR